MQLIVGYGNVKALSIQRSLFKVHDIARLSEAVRGCITRDLKVLWSVRAAVRKDDNDVAQLIDGALRRIGYEAYIRSAASKSVLRIGTNC